jgi:hypothetical protein
MTTQPRIQVGIRTGAANNGALQSFPHRQRREDRSSLDAGIHIWVSRVIVDQPFERSIR